MIDHVGQQLGNYRLISLIGRGGFAEVYLGEHVYLKTRTAIKVLQTRLAKEDREGFLAEARTIAHLQHDHIVSILEFGVEGSTPFLVMEYAPNGTLRQRHTRGTPLSLEKIIPYAKQVADALQYAHEEKLIHRDIKPENMLLGESDEVLLSDFGIALVIKSSRYQEKEEVVGTISYMAPEQLRGKPRPASDQYALGVVIYEWLSGDRPFLGSFTEIASQHLLTPPPPLHERVPTVSPAVEEVVGIALAKDPQRRFGSVREFADALQQVSAGAPFTAPSLVSDQPIVLVQSSTDSSLSPLSQEQAGQAKPLSPLPDSSPQQSPQTVQQLGPLAVSQRVQPRRSLSPVMKTFFVVLVLLIIGGGGFIYFTMLLRPVNSTTQTSTHLKISAFQEIYNQATNGTPILHDSLSGESIITWNSTGLCTFSAGALHANKPRFDPSQSDFETFCGSPASNFGNFAYQVQMTTIAGDRGYLFFRDFANAKLEIVKYYLFFIDPKGLYGLKVYTILLANKTPSVSIKVLAQGTSSAIRTGLNQSNLVTVVAHDSNIYLYVNKQYIASVIDSASSSGAIGVGGASKEQDVDVAFNNAQVWIL